MKNSFQTASSIVHTATLAALWIAGDYFQRRLQLFIMIAYDYFISESCSSPPLHYGPCSLCYPYYWDQKRSPYKIDLDVSPIFLLFRYLSLFAHSAPALTPFLVFWFLLWLLTCSKVRHWIFRHTL